MNPLMIVVLCLFNAVLEGEQIPLHRPCPYYLYIRVSYLHFRYLKILVVQYPVSSSNLPCVGHFETSSLVRSALRPE